MLGWNKRKTSMEMEIKNILRERVNEKGIGSVTCHMLNRFGPIRGWNSCEFAVVRKILYVIPLVHAGCIYSNLHPQSYKVSRDRYYYYLFFNPPIKNFPPVWENIFSLPFNLSMLNPSAFEGKLLKFKFYFSSPFFNGYNIFHQYPLWES